MHRFAALSLLCALVAGALLAAPAPFPRPVKPWVTDWGSPVDPAGDCRFDRVGDKLTITVPGKDHSLDVANGRLHAPHLLREVEGDFVVQVRVGAVRLPPGRQGSRKAGLLMLLGRGFVTLQRAAVQSDDEWTAFFLVGARYPTIPDHLLVRYRACWPPDSEPAHLRLERRGDWLTLEVSEDGKAWKRARGPFCYNGFRAPRRLKVGVVAEATGEASFKATFDQFTLKPLGDKGAGR
jgi:hypothetical protein